MAIDSSLNASPGKRDAKVAVRNAAIEQAAMMLAEAEKWPSPAAIAKRTGISESVIDRETDRLLAARRHWVENVGHDHPQWIDPNQGVDGDAVVREARPVKLPDEGREARRKALRRLTGQKLRRLTSRVDELEELNRRMNLGVRPAEVQQILDAGAKKDGPGKAKKGVGVGAGEDAG